MAVGQTLDPQNVFLVICIVIINVMWFNALCLRTAPTMCRERGLLAFFLCWNSVQITKISTIS